MDKTITIEELLAMEAGSYDLYDIRSASNTAYGMIPGAKALSGEDLKAALASLPPERLAILTCTRGEESLRQVDELQALHKNLLSLEGGYQGYLLWRMEQQKKALQASEGEEEVENKEAENKEAENKEAENETLENREKEEEERVEGKSGPDSKEGSHEEEASPRKVRRGRADEKELSIQEKAELSIRKKFHKQLFTPFARACRDYELLSPGDRVAVCISGGKDSMLMAKLFQELRRHDKFPFELVFLVMDPGYAPLNRALIEHNAQILGIPATIFETTIFDAVYTVEKNPCYLCARMRRGHLYAKAKELGCNKIALGHHYDDVIETILMGMLYGGQVQTMMPKLHSTNFPPMELIRPMYLIREEDIKRWRDYNGLSFLQCACHFTETCSSCDENGQSDSKRLEIKQLIAQLKQTNPSVEANIFRSVENVNLSTCICYKQDGVRHSFLESYGRPESQGKE